MNAPLKSTERSHDHAYAHELREDLIGVVQHAVAALDATVPWAADFADYHASYLEAQKAAFHFVTALLDPLMAVPAYLTAQHATISDNLYAASNCIEILGDNNTSTSDKEKAAEYLRIQADTIYFCLNNSCGKAMTLHGNLLYATDKITDPVMNLREAADALPHALDADSAKLDLIETQKQHLAAQLRAASWQLLDGHGEAKLPVKLAGVEVAADLCWTQIPTLAVIAQVGDHSIPLTSNMLCDVQAKIRTLHQGLSVTEQDIFQAQAVAAAFSGLMMHARDILAQRIQIADLFEDITRKLDAALDQCAVAQKALKDSDYDEVNAALLELANNWRDVSTIAAGLGVDIAYSRNDCLQIGMAPEEIINHLDQAPMTRSLVG